MGPRPPLWVLCAALAGCGTLGPGDDVGDGDETTIGSDSDPTVASDPTVGETEAEIGWFEIGWGETEYVTLADGDDFPIVRGGQGAEMFPVPLRGGEFYLPGNPTTWMDEDAPLIDIEIDIEGFNDGPGGHFKRIANYPVDWDILEDGTYQSAFIAVIVPDGIDTDQLEGLPAHVWVRLRPFEQPALVRELDLVVTVLTDPPG